VNEPLLLTINLGDRITFCADAAGGKAALADVIGVSPQQIRRYCSGECSPTSEPLARIAKAGQVTADWLLFGKGNPRADLDTERALSPTLEATRDPLIFVTSKAGVDVQAVWSMSDDQRVLTITATRTLTWVQRLMRRFVSREAKSLT
jgi:transcriptional regulator with XRE-family HTH domain